MNAEQEKQQPGDKVRYHKLTFLQYVLYLGVTPCALAALALLVFIVVRGTSKDKDARRGQEERSQEIHNARTLTAGETPVYQTFKH